MALLPLSTAGVEAAKAILSESIIDQKVPRPRLGEWWQEVLARFAAFVGSLLNLDSAVVRTLMAGVAWTVIVGAALALIWFLLSWWRRTSQPTEASFTVAPGVLHRRSHTTDWAAQLERALEQRRVAAALEAIWFLIAGRLAAPGNDDGGAWTLGKEWTGRRLLARAGERRVALASPVRELERYTYGHEETSIDQVRSLWRRLDRLVPAAAVHESEA